MRNMEGDYPKFDKKGADNIVTLRVPRFGSYAFYDPTIEAGYEAGCGALRASLTAICAALLAFIVLPVDYY